MRPLSFSHAAPEFIPPGQNSGIPPRVILCAWRSAGACLQQPQASLDLLAVFHIQSGDPLAHRAGQLIGDGVQNGRQVIHPLAAKYGCTAGQIALAWLLAQYDRLVPIPGTKHTGYLAENARAANIELEKSDIESLNNLHRRIAIKGDRYSAEGMKGVNA